MNYIVRVWVDLEIEAESKEKAKEIAHKYPIEIKASEQVSEYDMQVAEVWLKD